MSGSSIRETRRMLTPAEMTVRKGRMLGELQATMRRRVLRRRVVTMATVLAAPCIACGVVVAVYSGVASHPGIDAPSLVSATTPPPAVSVQSDMHAARPLVAVVHTDIAAIASFIAKPGPQTMIKTMTDDELLDILSQTGRPSGIVRVRGEAFITDNASVSDTDKREPSGPDGPGAMRRHWPSQTV